MRRPALFLPLFALAACSAEPPANTTADINAAAAEAKGDIDTYAANTLQPVPSPSAASSPAAATPARTPVADAPFAPDSAQAAADVVQRYFALIEAANYAAAYRLWEERGAASGMTARQFADSFARYASYHAQVGAPGDVDAGAGQRHVAVPVTVSGTLAQGRAPFRLAGSVTLHRVGDVDGATVEQRSWRIRDTALKPRPAEAAMLPGTASVDCGGALTRVSARDDAASRSAGGRDSVWRDGPGGGRSDAAGCTRSY